MTCDNVNLFLYQNDTTSLDILNNNNIDCFINKNNSISLDLVCANPSLGLQLSNIPIIEGPQGEQGPPGPPGPSTGIVGYWGSFWDTTNQTGSTTTPQPVLLGHFDTNSNGISVQNGNEIHFSHSGVYNIQYSFQFTNTDTGSASDIVYIWLRKNDTGSSGDLPDTNSIYQIPTRVGNNSGKLIAAVNYVYQVSSGDYFQIMWLKNNVSITMETISAGSNYPRTPSAIVTVCQIANAT